ncbi:RICIN domain-containing protein [Mucilaginibacter sp. 21P]|uniref:EndoS/ChiA family endoglycosidase n=1 Tax=Mucilaginibacter sp. 21P TaxID=2778902 RepID=UPI001C56EE94|nr:RICIN domain-containing protein [Mucilaginibacter sp. 21P]QXV63796.1 RICIN domain-containing protein [Mucilaginibacter sp. 21P]
MKKKIQWKCRLLILAAMVSVTACKKGEKTAIKSESQQNLENSSKRLLTSMATSNGELIAYKASKHEISAGFYRVQGPCYGPGLNGSDFSAVPDSLDVLILFCFSDSSPIASKTAQWITNLHAKGTKVLVTGNLDLINGASHNQAGYQATAKSIMDNLINKYGFDGYDIDVESNPTGTQLQDMVGVYTALSAYLGPKSGTGKLLTFDTNQDGNNNMFRQVYALVSYVWLQAYGRSVTTLQSTWNTFSPYISADKFIPGFSYYEENGYPSNVWYDVNYPVNGTGRAFDFAKWEPTGNKKGGVFGYAIDRDASLTSATDNKLYVPSYVVTNKLIQTMNPPVSGTTDIISGSSYEMITAANNTSVLDVPGSATADGTKVNLWIANNPLSNNQKWRFTSVGSGYYKIQPLNAITKALDVESSGTADGTKVQIYTDNGTNAQKWLVKNVGNGYYTLSPANAPSSCLDVPGGKTTNGTVLQIYTANSTASQKFKLLKL